MIHVNIPHIRCLQLILSIQSNLAVVLVQSIRDQTISRLAHQIGRGFSSKTQRIQPAPDWLRILLRNGRGFSMKSKWIKFAPGQLLDRFLGSNVQASYQSGEVSSQVKTVRIKHYFGNWPKYPCCCY